MGAIDGAFLWAFQIFFGTVIWATPVYGKLKFVSVLSCVYESFYLDCFETAFCDSEL